MLRVLADGRPRKVSQIVAEALKIATDLNGRTPRATLEAILVLENARASDGLFRRVDHGTYELTERGRIALRHSPFRRARTKRPGPSS
jgi:hypothetical protein